MEHLKRLIHEVHRRSLWQVTGIYLLGSWGALEAVQGIVEAAGLPDTLPGFALVLLVVGFPIVVATAFVQEGVGGKGRGDDAGSGQAPAAEAPAASGTDTPATSGKNLAAGTGSLDRRRTGPNKWQRMFTWRNALVGGVCAFALWGVLAAAMLLLQRWIEAPEQTSAVFTFDSELRRTIAVLPLENMSAEEENAYFTRGIHDNILSRLAQIDDLTVISRTSVMQYEGTEKPIRVIADELGVGTVLEGSVQRVGDQMLITTQLIDAGTDAHLWSESYDRRYSVAEVFDIQSEIASRIAMALQATLSPETRARMAERPTDNEAAYEAYLRGQDHWWRETNAGRRDAIVEMERAVELDPGFARAWADLGMLHTNLYFFGADRTQGRLQQARAALEEASRLAPDDPHVLLRRAGYAYQGERDYDRALELIAQAEPSLGETQTLGFRAAIYRRQGRMEEAADAFARQFELDPRSTIVAQNAGLTLSYVGRFEEAIEHLDMARALNPEFSAPWRWKADVYKRSSWDLEAARRVLEEALDHTRSAGIVQSWFWLELADRNPEAALYWAEELPEMIGQQYGAVPRTWFVGEARYQLGDEAGARAAFEDAREALERMAVENPEAENVQRDLAWVYGRLGRADEALRTAEKAVELMPMSYDALLAPYFVRNLAVVQAMVGRTDDAIATLEEFIELRPVDFWPDMPVYDPLREHPRFVELAGERWEGR